MSNAPLMPKATAVWLVENTGLSFRQIADFCHLHELEVKGIADGDVAQGIKGLDPVTSGQLNRDEIGKGEADPNYRLKLHESPVSRRQDRPDAIAWLLRNHPELPDAAIMKLVGTTKPTIQSIRDRTHWNSVNIKPVDPVTLGLCTQLELDLAVRRAARKSGSATVESGATNTLLPAAEALREPQAPEEESEERGGAERDYNPESVFARLKPLKPEGEEDS
jgi:uncharacterized protein